jgi:hypothetical protein
MPYCPEPTKNMMRVLISINVITRRLHVSIYLLFEIESCLCRRQWCYLRISHFLTKQMPFHYLVYWEKLLADKKQADQQQSHYRSDRCRLNVLTRNDD